MSKNVLGDLFGSVSNLKLVRITESDVGYDTDNLKLFLQLIKSHENMYPSIMDWLKKKVLPGIRSKERIAYMCLDDDEPVASSILKLGNRSKFCHLHIKQHLQGNKLGEMFFSLMAIHASINSQVIHFTLPESLWADRKDFFRSFGFFEVVKSKRQYRAHEEELHCSADFATVWQHVLEKIPAVIKTLSYLGDTIFNGILMSLKPIYLEGLRKGEKAIELRKKFSDRWKGCRVTIYSSSPIQAISGHAVIDDVKRDKPQEIWQRHKDELGCTKAEFDKYVGSADNLYAVWLKNYEPYFDPISLEQLRYLLRKPINPPQSYTSLTENSEWANAVGIAELLHGRFRLFTSTFLPKDV